MYKRQVAACGRCLQIPSGLSTPRAPQATPAPGSVSRNLNAAGTNRVLWLRINVGVWWRVLRGPPHAGRAGGLVGAYAASCVVMMPLRVWRVCIAILRRMGGVRSDLPANADACRTQPIVRRTRDSLPIRRVARVRVLPSKRLPAARHPSLYLSLVPRTHQQTTLHQRASDHHHDDHKRVCRLRAARAAAVGGQRKSRH